MYSLEHSDGFSAADCLLDWFWLFGVVPTFASDEIIHIRNALIQNINRLTHSEHHLTTLNFSQSNRTVEGIFRNYYELQER